MSSNIPKTRSFLVAAVLFAVATTAGWAGPEVETDPEGETRVGGAQVLAPTLGPQVYATPAEYQRVTGNQIPAFKEAPTLAARVQSGELPPVDQRVSQEPLVLEPEEIGQYGGVYRRAQRDGEWYFVQHLLFEMPVNYSPDMYVPGVTEVLEPNVFKSVDITDGGRTFTFKLRAGMKWSDGTPFTADDFEFFYNDIALNTEMKPTGVREFKLGGQMAAFQKIDEHTVRYSFPEPHGLFLDQMARVRYTTAYAPRHFLEQFHRSYVSQSDLDSKVRAAGYDSWVNLLNAELDWWANPDSPTLNAWIPLDEIADPIHRFTRNPYYWKIDTEGNQLPYIDEVRFTVVPDAEAAILKIIAGEVDWEHGNAMGNPDHNITVFSENMTQGNYTIDWMREPIPRAWGAVYFNFSHEDPVLHELFNNKLFRIALSVAIDREEINQVIFQGTYEESQRIAPMGSPYYGELPMYNNYSQYDPDLANGILDSLGLEWNRDRTQRLRPDGRPLNLLFNMGQGQVDIAELVRKHWAEIGVNVVVRPISREALYANLYGNQYDLHFTNIGVVPARPSFPGTSPALTPLQGERFLPNPAWAKWIVTDGAEGDEPPADVKLLADLSTRYLTEVDEAEKTRIAKTIVAIHVENFWFIASIIKPEEPGVYQIMGNRLRNSIGWRSWAETAAQPSQFWISQ